MRTLFATLFAFTLIACSKAEDKTTPGSKAPDAKTLKIGDPAPALHVTKWMKGAEVKSFEAGKTYVVDFWATWCGPCIASMPHMNELQQEYKAAGLTAIALSTKDNRGNDEAAVEDFVKNKATRFDFTYAYADNDTTYDAYMTAAGQNGIPCSFVIDKAGKIAFIGHPMELDDVLPKVVAGTWRGQEDIDAIAAMTKELGDIFEKAEKEPAGAVKAILDFEAKYPIKAKQSMFKIQKLAVIMLSKDFEAAKAFTEVILPQMIEKKNAQGLLTFGEIWKDDELNPEKKHIALAVKATEAALAIAGDKDAGVLRAAANAQFKAGNKEKAIELQKKAIENAGSERAKEFLTNELKKYQE